MDIQIGDKVSLRDMSGKDPVFDKNFLQGWLGGRMSDVGVVVGIGSGDTVAVFWHSDGRRFWYRRHWLKILGRA